jgi:hypothetical protein
LNGWHAICTIQQTYLYFRFMYRLIVCLTFLTLTKAYSQTCSDVLFTGRVKDTIEHQTFYNLMIINRQSNKGVFGQPNGTFSTYVKTGDTLILSVAGYDLFSCVVQPDSNCQYKVFAPLTPKSKLVDEVVIRPLKSLDQIREEREALAMRETRTVTGVDVFQSPITALYQAFSKKEQNKRWIAEQEYKDDQRRVVKELLRLYVAYEIIDLSEEEFDSFITFLNLNERFLQTATEMELVTFIKDKYLHYNELVRDK